MKLIKKPVNFIIGIFCFLSCILHIVNRKYGFTIAFEAMLAIMNISFGLSD